MQGNVNGVCGTIPTVCDCGGPIQSISYLLVGRMYLATCTGDDLMMATENVDKVADTKENERLKKRFPGLRLTIH